MTSNFDFCNINQYCKYIINISKNDYKKIKIIIKFLQDKYMEKISNLYNIEMINSKQFNFYNQKKFIIEHKQIVLNIIKDIIELYNDELRNLGIVLLTGSFSRGTNKMSSDIDLHFFYNTDEYNFVYEEIVCYIISRILRKSRDCIDPTFIFNIDDRNKTIITNKMDNTKLTIILKYKTKKLKYSYRYEKKRRFYLQYTNSRNINKLFKYLNEEMINDNREWSHNFEIIRGKQFFYKLYDILYYNENNIINNVYINKKIKTLKERIKLNNIEKVELISEYKNYYQSEIFKLVYEYISIIRFILISENNMIKHLNLLEIYDFISSKSKINKIVFIKIYKYMWSLEQLSIFCYKNKINYGLHNHCAIDYPTNELDKNLITLKKILVKELERLEKLYE